MEETDVFMLPENETKWLLLQKTVSKFILYMDNSWVFNITWAITTANIILLLYLLSLQIQYIFKMYSVTWLSSSFHSECVFISWVITSTIGITSNYIELYMLPSFKVTRMMKAPHWIWMTPVSSYASCSIELSLLRQTGRTYIYTHEVQITQQSQ